MPHWFYFLSAILDYVLSLRYDRRAYVLKLLWCLYDPKGIGGYYLSDKCCKCLDASMIFIENYICKCWDASVILKKTTFLNVGMPWWFYDLECNSRLWIVTQIWYTNLNFKIIMMSLWPERNRWILFVR